MDKYYKPRIPSVQDREGDLQHDLSSLLKPVAVLHENPWFVVKNRGGYFTSELLMQPLIVLPIIDDQAVVMVQAIRPVLNDCPFELPAGAVEKGETLVQAAARELLQETGIAVSNLSRFEMLAPMILSPNREPRPLYILKINLKMNELRDAIPHDDEIQEVRCLSFDEFIQLFVDGFIYVSTPAAIIARYLMKRFDFKS